MYDLIGDIHGHADKLHQLLDKLGYIKKSGSWTHPERQVIFVGDYIDRGPKIKATLETVKAMVDNGDATAIMGNHEFNALCFHTKDKNGNYLRPHTQTNVNQHFQTLEQFENHLKDWEYYLDWFYSLPLFFETNLFNVVHACWDQEHIDFLKTELTQNKLNLQLLHESMDKSSPLFQVIEETLKGKEFEMPDGQFFLDKDNHKRLEMRIRWWENPDEMTLKSWSVLPIENLPETPVTLPIKHKYSPNIPSNKHTFFGHYWLTGQPIPFKSTICCLDYSVGKGGDLVAYRFDGEDVLSDEKFVWV